MLQIGNNLKKIRHLTGLTQTEFADKFEVTLNQQKSYESNRAKPGIAYMEKLSELTGETAGNLLNKEYSLKQLKIRNSDQGLNSVIYKPDPEPIDYKAAYNQSIQLSLAALLEGQALMRQMMTETLDNTRAIRLAVSPDSELLKAYEQSKATAEKLKSQKMDTRMGKSGKG